MLRNTPLRGYLGCLVLIGASAIAWADDPIEQALNATFRITNGKTSATSFLIYGPEAPEDGSSPLSLLVTAAHVFGEMSESECTVILRRRQEDGTYERQEAQVALRNGDQQLWVRHDEVDIAVVPFELPEDTAARPLFYEQLADASWSDHRRLRAGSDVLIPGYPAQLESNDAGWPVLRRGSVATHPLVPADSTPRMLVNATTFGGDSGAPVILLVDGDPIVVGIVSGMIRQTNRANTPFEERVTHMPVALAITVQAPFIRTTVAKLLEGSEDPSEAADVASEDSP